MKHTKIVMASLAAGLLLTACGKPASHGLTEGASPETSLMTLWAYDGTNMSYAYLSDDAMEAEILAKLDAVQARPVTNPSTEHETVPMYGIEIGTADGMGLLLGWSNGYLYNRDGTVYEFDFDFASLAEEYPFEVRETWETESNLWIPSSYYMVRDENGWNPAFMMPAELKEMDGVFAEAKEISEDRITLVLTNDTAEEWCYGEYFSVHAKLDGEWYVLPTKPDRNWAFIDIGYLLMPGASETRTYQLEMFGELPAGEYRLVVNGDSDVFCEFTMTE
ncbi:MAG: immunoglobulin-like domain-containing protein [Eubacteriales bacterium]